MPSVNFTLLGEESIGKDFGKKGTATDLTIYDKQESEFIRTWTAPTGFPEKIQPLFQAINMGEYVIFYVTKLDKFTGEQIVALDSLKKTQGILCHSYDVDRVKLLSMIKGTVVEQYKLVEFTELKKEMDSLEPVSKDGKTKIVIDHCFDVKGVGTVILGKVTQGKVKAYDNLQLLPKGADVLIKSIQMHDDPATEAVSPARVGLSLKGAKPDEINRGDILCEDSSAYQIKSETELDFKKNPFYKGEISENQMCLVSIDMQVKAAKFVSSNPVNLRLDKPAIFDNDICVILKPDSENIRVLGSGTVR